MYYEIVQYLIFNLGCKFCNWKRIKIWILCNVQQLCRSGTLAPPKLIQRVTTGFYKLGEYVLVWYTQFKSWFYDLNPKSVAPIKKKKILFGTLDLKLFQKTNSKIQCRIPDSAMNCFGKIWERTQLKYYRWNDKKITITIMP